MNQISDPPNNNYTFGKIFDYAVWTPQTQITLANVPWSLDYRDVVRFSNGHTGLNAYIDAQPSTHSKTNMSYARFDAPISIDTPFNLVNRYNYIRVRNAAQPTTVGGADVQRDYYYFITGMQYINPNHTLISVEIDVWQTFGYDVTFGNCYIERGHIGIANEHAFDNFGRDYLTIPEGLDVGGEYRVIASRREKIMTNSWGTDGLEMPGIIPSEPGYDVLVCSTVDLTADAGTVDDPKLITASGGTIQNMPTGSSFYVFNGIQGFIKFMNDHKEKPWVTQGIISITAIPRIKRYIPNFDYDDAPGEDDMVLAPALGLPTLTHDMLPNWRTDPAGVINFIPERYRGLKKLFTYPYMVIEMTTWSATPIIIKPESWANPHATITESVAIVPPNQRVVFSPQRYNADPNSGIEAKKSWLDFDNEPAGWPYPGDLGDGDDQGEYLDFTTIIANFPTMAIVNNSAIGYMAQNAHGIAFQTKTADWAQDRALRSAANSYYASQVGLQAERANYQTGRTLDSNTTNIGISAANQSMLAQGVAGVVTGAAGGATGGPLGAGVGAGMGTIGAVAASVQTGIGTQAQSDQLAARGQAAKGILDTNQRAGNTTSLSNQQLANWAAKGDYENVIAGNQARIQDAQLTQPTTSGQVGGEAFNLIQNNVEVSLRWKLIDKAAIAAVGEYWLRYGYSIRRFGRVPADFMVMTKFTYWKLAETYILSAPMPELFKQTIRGIFEKGVTVWANPNDIGNIDLATNTPKAGVTL